MEVRRQGLLEGRAGQSPGPGPSQAGPCQGVRSDQKDHLFVPPETLEQLIRIMCHVWLQTPNNSGLKQAPPISMTSPRGLLQARRGRGGVLLDPFHFQCGHHSLGPKEAGVIRAEGAKGPTCSLIRRSSRSCHVTLQQHLRGGVTLNSQRGRGGLYSGHPR